MRLSLSQKLYLPGYSGLYAVINRNKIIYVGMSRCIARRWFDHSLLKTLRTKYPKCYIECMEINEEEMHEYEKYFINLWKPKLNKGIYKTTK